MRNEAPRKADDKAKQQLTRRAVHRTELIFVQISSWGVVNATPPSYPGMAMNYNTAGSGD